jgi:hypothetical protein
MSHWGYIMAYLTADISFDCLDEILFAEFLHSHITFCFFLVLGYKLFCTPYIKYVGVGGRVQLHFISWQNTYTTYLAIFCSFFIY